MDLMAKSGSATMGASAADELVGGARGIHPTSRMVIRGSSDWTSGLITVTVAVLRQSVEPEAERGFSHASAAGPSGDAERPRDEPPGQRLDGTSKRLGRSWTGRLHRVVRRLRRSEERRVGKEWRSRW